MRELDFLDWIRSQSDFDPAVVPVGPGDDCAVINHGNEKLIVTTDQLLDGVHFQLEKCGPKLAGRKAMARNLSDIAAMASEPTAATATVALPQGFSQTDAQELYRGLREIGDKFNCCLVGGDVGSWDKPLAISVTVFASPSGIEPVLRSTAKAGDAVCVTGQMGRAWKTTKHLEFTPRIREARELASQYGLSAMIDISDGLAIDLGRLCKASGVGARINSPYIPLSESASLAEALGDGEDYELLFTLPQDKARELLDSQPLGVKVAQIGEITEATELLLIEADGQGQPLKLSGWEHKT